jgi:phenylalanyl-tRNA synthetase beta chain
MLVIADDKKAVAIAGVMGGLNSEIEENTTTVVFESAVFNGGNVRKTAKKVGLRTEASSRYEKGLSPENALRAANRAVELAVLIGAGEEVEGKIDVYPTKQNITQVKLDVERINNLLGLNVSEKEMVDILEKLDMKVENGYVIPPYFRTDINYVADLAEEVARFYGYDKIESTLIEAETTLGIRTKSQKIQDKIREALVNKGLSEIYTYGFYNPNELDKCCITEDSDLRSQTIKLRNPLSEDYSVMRTTTLPSMMQTLSTNSAKKNKNVALFDISRVYRDVNGQISEGKNPTEEMLVTIGCYGDNIDFYVLKGLVETVFKVSSVLRYEVISEKSNPSYHPGKTAKICIGKDVVATFGEIHPEVCENYDVSNRVYVAEISVDKLVKYARVDKKYVEVPKYPAVERDIAMLVDEDIEVAQIEKIIVRKGKKILEEVELFDVYRNDKLGNKKKSIAYSLKFRAKDRTLTDEEINKTMEEIIAELEKTLGAELRK